MKSEANTIHINCAAALHGKLPLSLQHRADDSCHTIRHIFSQLGHNKRGDSASCFDLEVRSTTAKHTELIQTMQHSALRNRSP